jgi:hypothetical protein
MDPATQSAIRFLDTFWGFFAGLRVLFIVLDIGLIGLFGYLVRKAMEVRPRFHGDSRPRKRVISLRQTVFKDKWDALLKKFHSGSPEAIRITVIEADSLVDETLKHMGLPGEHMADRLSQLTLDDVPSLNRVWKAHRLRNDIVHRSGFSFTLEEAQQALGDFEAFLTDVGAL